MNLTQAKYDEIRIWIDAGYNTDRIMRYTGYSQEQVLEARLERRRSIERERALEKRPDPGRDFLAALRAHLPPLTSLPAHVATLGACVSIGRGIGP